MSIESTHEAGRLWTEYQLEDDTVAPVYEGIAAALKELETLPHGIVSMNSRANIERSLQDKGLLDRFAGPRRR